ncbi:MAG: HEAT repeat domain-containing protein [Planctomycetota bacterium]
MIALLKDENASVRVTTAWALGSLGSPAFEPLIAALKDEDVRYLA